MKKKSSKSKSESKRLEIQKQKPKRAKKEKIVTDRSWTVRENANSEKPKTKKDFRRDRCESKNKKSEVTITLPIDHEYKISDMQKPRDIGKLEITGNVDIVSPDEGVIKTDGHNPPHHYHPRHMHKKKTKTLWQSFWSWLSGKN